MQSILQHVTDPANAALFTKVSKFTIHAFPEDFVKAEPDASLWFVEVENRGHNSWAVLYRGYVYDKDLVKEYEPLPSSRTKKFKKRFRHDLPTAIRLAETLAHDVTMMGMNWEAFMVKVNTEQETTPTLS